MDEEMQKRLVYVKGLYIHGQDHAKSQLEFDRMIALHHFDNAVELLLKCIATKENVDLGKRRHTTFPELWGKVDSKLRERNLSLPKKTEMLQLHDLRGDIQHWGISTLSLDVVNRFQIYSGDFIQSTLKEVFDVQFEKLALSLLIKDETIRNLLTKAEVLLQNDPKESMKCSSAAFSLAIEKERTRMGLRFPELQLAFTPNDKTEIKAVDHRLVKITETLRDSWEKAIAESLSSLEDIIDLLVLRINVNDYVKFKRIAPIVAWLNGRPVFQLNFNGEEVGDFSKENAFLSFNFILKQVLQWQELW